MGGTSLPELRKAIQTYLMVFGSLLFLTLVTVGLSYIHFSRPVAVGLGVFVALVKASLVAYYFMHLNHEKALIYLTILITLVLFAFVFAISFF